MSTKARGLIIWKAKSVCVIFSPAEIILLWEDFSHKCIRKSKVDPFFGFVFFLLFSFTLSFLCRWKTPWQKAIFPFQHLLYGKDDITLLLRIALCSWKFQNVKLRIDYVEVWSFYRNTDFTWNLSLVNSNHPKLLFLPILEVLNFDFSKSEQLSSPKLAKIQSSESLELPKMTFLTDWILQNLVSRKIGVAV